MRPAIRKSRAFSPSRAKAASTYCVRNRASILKRSQFAATSETLERRGLLFLSLSNVRFRRGDQTVANEKGPSGSHPISGRRL